MTSIRCGCGATYQITPAYYGTQFACTTCSQPVFVPNPNAGLAAPASMIAREAVMTDRSGLDSVWRFGVKQKRLAINASYYIRDESQRLVLFAFRPIQFLKQMLVMGVLMIGVLASLMLAVLVFAISESLLGDYAGIPAVLMFFLGFGGSMVLAVFLSPLRHVTFYADEAKTRAEFEVLQLERWQFPYANYTVRSMDGQVIGRLRQNVIWGILRKRWEITGAAGQPIAVAKEDSVVMAFLRRFFGPMYGLLRLNFIFVEGTGEGENHIAKFNREFSIWDSYVLDLSADPNFKLDRRLAIAQAVMLDTGERR